LGVFASAAGLLLIALAEWITSTVPGDMEANAWLDTAGVSTGLTLLQIALVSQVVGFITCSIMSALGAYRLWRRFSDAERASLTREIAWNVVGVLIPVATWTTILSTAD
jgi:hypothetical protein